MHYGSSASVLSQISCRFIDKWLRPLGSPSRRFSASVRKSAQSRHNGRTIFSGIQPTGIPHLGNYLGALRQWQMLQAAAADADQLYFCIADLHALTDPRNTVHLKRWRNETLASLLAVGLDPQRCNIFFQSSVAEHSELMWILTCNASVGHLARMTQWKSKLSSAELSLTGSNSIPGTSKLGLLSYPVLQAADILLYGATHVPVGIDQAQHLEFTRSIATTFNSTHGRVFVEPQTLFSPVARVLSLKDPGLKMSKSDPEVRSRILINDSSETIQYKVSMAMTDSLPEITYDPDGRPGISNLLTIMSCFDQHGRPPRTLAEELSALSKRDFKNRASEMINAGLRPIRDRYNILLASNELHDTSYHGSMQARVRAATTMSKVRPLLGLD